MTRPAQSPSWEVQSSIYNLLKDDATLLAALPGGLFDYVPERATFPYGVYSDMDGKPWDTTTEYGDELIVQIGVFSRAEGRKEAKTAQRRIDVLLHDGEAALRAEGVLTGHHLVSIRKILETVVKEPDGQHYHGVQQFRVITEEI